LFCTLSLGLDYISNANPACSCDLVCKFQIRPIHPPSRRLSEFDLQKQNQVVAKNDPNMPNLNQNKIDFLFALMLHFFVAFYCVGINHQKGGD
jgi:hypothetical protein